ncbi:MAG: hypothetical protein ACM3VT_13665 [Solirubrobacterales bacterium]
MNVAGIIQQAYGEWMLQKAKNLADQFSGFMKDMKETQGPILQQGPALVSD